MELVEHYLKAYNEDVDEWKNVFGRHASLTGQENHDKEDIDEIEYLQERTDTICQTIDNDRFEFLLKTVAPIIRRHFPQLEFAYEVRDKRAHRAIFSKSILAPQYEGHPNEKDLVWGGELVSHERAIVC